MGSRRAFFSKTRSESPLASLLTLTLAHKQDGPMNADASRYIFSITIDKNQRDELNAGSDLEEKEYREKINRLHGYRMEVQIEQHQRREVLKHDEETARYECKMKRVFVAYAMDFVSGDVPAEQWDQTMPPMNLYDPEGKLILNKL